MAQHARQFAAGGYHHLTVHSHTVRQLFRDPENCAVYLRMLTAAKRRTGLALYHYCLLRQKVQLILGVEHAQMIS